MLNLGLCDQVVCLGLVIWSDWSSDYRVAPNPLNRFKLQSYSPLKNELDGSLKIAIGPKPVLDIPHILAIRDQTVGSAPR